MGIQTKTAESVKLYHYSLYDDRGYDKRLVDELSVELILNECISSSLTSAKEAYEKMDYSAHRFYGFADDFNAWGDPNDRDWACYRTRSKEELLNWVLSEGKEVQRVEFEAHQTRNGFAWKLKSSLRIKPADVSGLKVDGNIFVPLTKVNR